MLERLFQVGNLAGKLTLRRFVLGVLLLDLGKVLHLDRLSLEDAALHVLDHLFLLLAQLFVPQLHAMDLTLHGDNLSLADGGVKSVLHFLLELDLTLPKQNLPFGFNDIGEDLSLLVLERTNAVLELDAFILKVSELLLELLLGVDVLLLQFFALVLVVVQ